MADRLRLVRYDPGDMLVTACDLQNDALGIRKVRGTFTVTPGAPQPVFAQSEYGRGGQRQIDKRSDNGSVGATWMVTADTGDEALAKVEAMLAEADANQPDRYIEWRPDGTSYSSLFKIMGSASSRALDYQWEQFVSGKVNVSITWPVAPLVEERRMSFTDDFSARGADTGLVNLVHNPRGTPTLTDWSATSATIASNLLNVGWVVRATATAAANYGPYNYPNAPRARPVPGRKYAARGRFAGSSNGARTARVQLEFRDAAGVLIAGSTLVGTTVAPGNDSAVVGVAPPEAASMLIAFYTVNGGVIGETIDVTMLMVCEVPAGTTVAPAFFDGDTAFGRWIGARGASHSALTTQSKLEDYDFASWPSNAPNHVSQGYMLRHAPTVAVYKGARPFSDGEVSAYGEGLATNVGHNYAVSPGIKWRDDDRRFVWATYESTLIRIYSNEDGVNTLRATTGATTAITPGVPYRVTIRAEGPRYTAEYWHDADAENVGDVSTASVTWDATALPQFADREGYPMPASWGMAGTDHSRLRQFRVRSHVYKDADLPAVLALPALPGTADALVDVDVEPMVSPAFNAARFLLLSWNRRQAPLSDDPSGAVNGLTAMAFSAQSPAGNNGGANLTDAALRGSGVNAWRITVAGGAITRWVDYLINPTYLDEDRDVSEVELGVWVRHRRTSGFDSPRLAASLYNVDGIKLQATPEFGNTGRLLTAATAQVARFTYLGTVRVNPRIPQTLYLRLTFTCGAATTNPSTMDLDEVYLTPTRRTAMAPTGKPTFDPAYPGLFPGWYVRRIRADLSSAMSTKATNPDVMRESPGSFGGAAIEPAAGLPLDFLVMASDLVPDDPTVDTLSAQKGHGATVRFRVTPRHHLVAT